MIGGKDIAIDVKNDYIKCSFGDFATSIRVYGIPLSIFDGLSKEEFMEGNGIFLLAGTSDRNGAPTVLVGVVPNRFRKNMFNSIRDCRNAGVRKHYKDAFIVTTKDGNMDSAALNYLGWKLFNEIERARYEAETALEPVTDVKTCVKEEMDGVAENVKVLMRIFGHNMFEKLSSDENGPPGGLKTFTLEKKDHGSNRILRATCIRTWDEFILKKGSDIADLNTDSLPHYLREMRRKAKKKGDIRDGKLQTEYRFVTPSAAAAFVTGTSIDGKLYWKDEDGVSLKILDEASNNDHADIPQ